MQTINEIPPNVFDVEKLDNSYQTVLTSKLENINLDFDQETINEIVLWKVNKYAPIDSRTLILINKINKSDKDVNWELTSEILLKLLRREQKGVGLTTASTFLKFKNPSIYQIIDSRVYRFIYGEKLKYSVTNLNEQIVIYLRYLDKLKDVCREHNVEFEKAHQLFNTMDKLYNFDE